MIILDTNVVSAIMQMDADSRLLAWLDRQPFEAFWTTTITLFEINLGIALLPGSRRKRDMEDAFEKVLQNGLAERIFVFDNAAAEYAAALDASRHKAGRKIEVRDTFIAGIVLAQRATLATRNIKHFADLDVEVVNPWAGN